MDNKSNLILGACIALGLIVLGVFINKGLQSFSNKERVVTVKGLAEQYVKADNATIVIDIRFTSDDPKSIVSAKDMAISRYLTSICSTRRATTSRNGTANDTSM